MSSASIAPFDAPNRQTIAQGHPTDWQPPQPKDVYDLVVIGGGPAGLTAAVVAATGGHLVALVERNLMGGTCVNFGCTPSKALLTAARAVFHAKDGAKFGYVLADAPHVDFAAVMTRVRAMRAFSGSFDAVSVAAGAGIDVFLGDARFVSPDTIEVEGKRLRYKQALIATGSRPAVPDLPGLIPGGFLTNETVFELTALPERMVCLGGGTVNCELAQAFSRLGSEVHLVGNADRLLPAEAPAASAVIAGCLRAEGVRLHLGTTITSVDAAAKQVTLSNGTKISYDTILVAAGRKANVEGLSLEAAGVKYGAAGVQADEHLRTTNPAVYAAGDVARPEKYTHAAIAMAKLVVGNALAGAGNRVTDLVIPRCTYTDPEVAQVGVTPQEAAEHEMSIQTHHLELAKIERAMIDGAVEGFIDLYTSGGKIVGATLVSAHAGESVPLLTLAVMQKMTPAELSGVIHCYPTQVEAIQRVAAQAAE